MHYRVIESETPYTGRELRGGWVKGVTGLDGDAAVGFVGPCLVPNEDLVDLDDARAGEHIESASMAHVIVEHPGCSLRAGVLRQRMLVTLLCEMLRDANHDVRRDGDDVYCGGRKLTVSIAAPSVDATLIHLGINVDPAGAPVPAIGLGEMGVEPRVLLGGLLERYAAEMESCRHAEAKVRRVP
jgi:hypothetical protein